MLYKPRWIKFKGLKIGKNNEYLLSSIQGIEAGTVTSNNKDYIDTDGGKRSDVFYEMRPFTVVGYILADSADMAEKRRRTLSNSCSPKNPFELTYFNGVNKFAAQCFTDGLPMFEKINSKTFKFTVNFTIPGFYWNDVNFIHKNITAKEDLVINGEFRLPMVFTKMYNSAKVTNRGDVETYPVITVISTADSEKVSLKLNNDTTGKSLGINYKLSKGEVITFDNDKGTITSNINGNIYNSLIIESDFWPLKTGDNVISCLNENVQVNIKFKNKYEGV